MAELDNKTIIGVKNIKEAIILPEFCLLIFMINPF